MTDDQDYPFDGIDISSEDFSNRFDEITQGMLQTCPVVRTTDGWLLTAYEDVHNALVDWKTFSSQANGVNPPGRGYDDVRQPPIEMDPPLHGRFRQPFQKMLSPGRIAEREKAMRQLAKELALAVKTAGNCEVAKDFARPYIGTIFFREILGLPAEEAVPFTELVHELVNGKPSPDVQERYLRGINKLLNAQEGSETSEFIAALLDLDIDGRPATFEEKQRTLAIFIIGGLDTTVFVITQMLLRLSQSEADRRRLIADPSLIPAALEEALRLYTPAWILGRTPTKDVEVCGRHIEEGEFALVSFGLANRDHRKYPDPMQFTWIVRTR